MAYFLPITHTCLISALWLPPVWGVLPVAAGPHSSLQVPSPSHPSDGQAWLLSNTAALQSLSGSSTDPSTAQTLKADRMNCLRPRLWCLFPFRSHHLLWFGNSGKCVLFFFSSYFFLSASCRNYHVSILPFFRHQPLGNDDVYIEIDGCAWCFFFSLPCCLSF